MKNKTPKLPLSQEQKSLLRKKKMKICDIHRLHIEEIQELFSLTIGEAKTLKGLASFQAIPSIGYELAYKMVHLLGFYRVDQLRMKKWADVFQQLEQTLGCRTDSCVEDQIICIIHHANNPDSEKVWYDFTQERKEYRMKHGYPDTRPTMSWYEK
ncbi:helix-hairpin-helix domain-containing protein [Bacillus weihaiensis]|uniref:helix-hairpin-helix domain-containing protein n=1 Tax=Bacillus weihaiensis TaxID=1547283 RepID=UPI002352303D|nr:helix-hairpin-helix domain-containing protein [Bacillus weihaiensis]